MNGFVRVTPHTSAGDFVRLRGAAGFSAADLRFLRTGRRPAPRGPRLSTPLPADGSAPKGWTRISDDMAAAA